MHMWSCVPTTLYSWSRIVRPLKAQLVFGGAMLLAGTGITVYPTANTQFQFGVAEAATQAGWAGDIPMMKGLQVEPELGFAFDAPSGRIVMIFASTDANSAEIKAFYGESLGNLGWEVRGDGWVRGDESLSISQVSTAAGMLWRIMLRPR